MARELTFFSPILVLILVPACGGVEAYRGYGLRAALLCTGSEVIRGCLMRSVSSEKMREGLDGWMMDGR